MDARITKPRLSNLLSYDWLKILVAIAIAVAALCVFFTTVRPRPADTQIFTVYAYADINSGEDAATLEDDLLEKDIFSYEILSAQVEKLTETSSSGMFGGMYAGATYTTRLINEARTVMFVYGLDDPASDGYDAVETLIGVNRGTGETHHGFLDFGEYFSDCERYLTGFFGEDWRNGTLDTAAADACFTARNAKDKRFRSDEKKAAGIVSERERLEKLRSDLAAVLDGLESGLISYSTITVDDERAEQDGIEAGTYNCGVSLGKLSRLNRLFYYTAETESGSVNTVSGLSLILFRSQLLGDKTNDLRYETVSFLSYLLSAYGV